MRGKRGNWLIGCCSATAVILLAVTAAWSAEGRRPAKIGEFNPNDQTVEMFAAIEKGDIAVKLIQKDAAQGRVLIENKTKKPLNVKLPEAFAGVPVLAERAAGGGGGGHNRSGGGNNNMNQSMGGGMGGMGMGGMGGMGGGGMGGGMGMFNVPPEKVGQFKVTTVCLEHGKREPTEKVVYEVKPIETFTTTSGVRELCEAVGKGEINQRAAQAAAWHLSSGLSWEQLAAKQVHRANGARQPYFTADEIQSAMRISAVSVRTAKLREEKAPTASDASTSNR